MAEIITTILKLEGLFKALDKVDPEFSMLHLKILTLVAGNPGISQAELLPFLPGVRRTTLHRILMHMRLRSVETSKGDKLVGWGLVTTKQSLKDLKSLELHLTDRGRAVWKEIESVLTR